MSFGLAGGVIAIIMLFALVGCSYGHKHYNPTATIDRLPSSRVLVLEVTDYGRFWDRTAAESIYKLLEKESIGKNIVLVTFIHGWHHNAAVGDGNRKDFEKTVRMLQEKVNKPDYAESRTALGLKENVEVIGLYVGWRGESLPLWLDYLTFWGRKAAAERVGGGDLREFLLKVQNLYNIRNSDSKTRVSDTFMGMVTIGHSFGGQVALRTVAELLEYYLLDERAETDVVRGLGDLTVLLNPAVEASQYERIDRLTKTAKFIEEQSPVLLIVSADNDWPRGNWFPWGRRVSRLFRASFQTEEEAQAWREALGMYEPQQTHRFKVTDQVDSINQEESEAACEQRDFSRIPVITKVAMDGILGRSDRAYLPFIVASTDSPELIDGHNGIFSKKFINFLTDYVALTQGKMICVRRKPSLQAEERP